jgi:ubiquinone/menaquinone biosynthesis C-methylase UbiE
MSRIVPTVTPADAPRAGLYAKIAHNRAPGANTARIIAANQEFYRRIANKYDRYESCVFDPCLQDILEKDLNAIHSMFASLQRAPHCLDCGGGTGNVTLKMLARGWRVTVVDVSAEMLAVLEEKARAGGHSPRLVQASIEWFLDRTQEVYDLVTFSSVLHHVYSYMSVVERAIERLRPGGIFYSNYDPVVPKNPFWSRTFDSLCIAAAKLLLDPADLLPGVLRRFRKLFSRNDPAFGRAVVSPGDLAEFHVRTGVDDEQILQLLRSKGLSVTVHQRFATARIRAVQWLNERLQLSESFKIIARRDSGNIQS